MDQSVLLYSIVSQRLKFGDITKAEYDALELRSEELSLLFEDAVFDSKGIVRNGSTSGKRVPDTIVEEQKEPETIYEVSQALDEQILLGYQSTFTEDELEEWIERIDGLQQKLQLQLAALPPASNGAASTEAKAPPTPLDRMHGRLDSLRTSIDPEGSSILRLPLARPVISRKPKTQKYKRLLEPPVPTYSPPIVPITEAEDNNAKDRSDVVPEEAAMKIETETAAIEIIDTTVDPPALFSASKENRVFVDDRTEETPNRDENTTLTAVSQNKDKEGAIEVLNAISEEDGTISTAITKEEVTVGVNGDDDVVKTDNFQNAPVKAPIKLSHEISENEEGATMTVAEEGKMVVDEENVVADSSSEFKSEQVVEVDPVSSASEEKTIQLNADGTVELAEIPPPSEDESSTKTMDAEAVNAEEPQTDTSVTAPIQHAEQQPPPSDGETDVVTPLVATAAIGAAAVTANPLIVAGVALGPIIREAIASAKKRTRESKKSSTSKMNEKKSAFASKKNNDEDGGDDGAE